MNYHGDVVHVVRTQVHAVWPMLLRSYTGKRDSRAGTIVDSSLIDVPHPFIVPGGRFLEFYYWYAMDVGALIVVSRLSTFDLSQGLVVDLEGSLCQWHAPNCTRHPS